MKETILKPAVVNIEKDSIYRSLFEKRPEAVFLAMPDGTIIRANEAASRMFGYSEEEFKTIGRSGFLNFQDPRTQEALRQRLLNGHFFGEITGIRKNGEIFPLEASSNLFRLDNNEERAFTIFRDLTEIKRAEEKGRLERDRYNLIAKATNDAIWDWDIVAGDLHWGEGYRTLFGYKELEWHDSIDRWNKLIHPEDVERVNGTLMHTVFSTTGLQWQEEYRYRMSNGQYAFVLDRGFIIRNDKGEPLRMVGAIMDLTESKRNEIKLKELNIRLKKREVELIAYNEELEQFNYIVSHDLQEPLRMITGFLTRLENKYKEQLDEKAQQYIWFAKDGAQRMRNIIDDLLEYTRVGKQGYQLERIDTEELLRSVIRLNSTLIKDNNARIQWDSLPVIIAARTPMQQVFSNLINNAVKYSRPGVTPEIIISAKDEKNHWEFSFSDNGIGIDPDAFQRVFVLFQRLHSREDYAGTGIGLAICKKVIEGHGGKIWVESVTGKGSVFYFTISK
jgi:PAS domain S-box-containing protein